MSVSEATARALREKTWYLTLYTELGVFTMRELEAFVASGTLRVGMGMAEARGALTRKGWRFEEQARDR